MLRNYQEIPVQKAIDFFHCEGREPSLMVLPTAWGKSWLIAHVALSIADEDRLLVLQPSKELLEQNYEKYISLCGVIAGAGIYSASMRKKEISKITFATIGSIKEKGREFRELGVTKMLIDEAHMYPRKEESMIGHFLEQSRITHVLGVTATPVKMESVTNVRYIQDEDKDGHVILDPLGYPVMKKVYDGYSKQVILTNPSNDGEFYKEFLHVGQIGEMVALGYWSPLVYDVQPYDSRKLHYNSAGSEYSDKSIVDAYEANAVDERIKNALAFYRERSHCIVFVPSVEKARQLAEEVPGSAFVCGATPKKERTDIIARFKSGGLRVVFNVNVLSTGFDYPQIDLIILAFSTASISKYYQAIGRGVRICEGKRDCVVVDMCGNVNRFGRIECLNYENDGMWRLMGQGGKVLTGMPVTNIGQYCRDDIRRIQLNRMKLPNMLTFGKHKGKTLEETPSSYLQWLLGRVYNDPERQDLADAIRLFLENEVHDTTAEPPAMVMPTGKHMGEEIAMCPSGYLRWFYENTQWTRFNDSLRRGIEAALAGPTTLFDN